MPSVNVIIRIDEGVPTPTHSLLNPILSPILLGTLTLYHTSITIPEATSDPAPLPAVTSTLFPLVSSPPSSFNPPLTLTYIPSSSLSPPFASSSTFASTSTTSTSAVNTKTPSSSTTIPPSVSISGAGSISHNKNALIGGVVGGAVGLLVITALLVYYLIRRSRRGQKYDLVHATTFQVPPESIEQISEPELEVGPHPPALTPDISTINPSSVSSFDLTYPIPISDAEPKSDETTNQSSPDITMTQRDSVIDQSMYHSSRASPERIRPLPTIPQILPTIPHSTGNLNPLLRDILSATQGRDRGSSDPGDLNIPQNIQIIININQPLETNGSVPNENRENRGVHYDRSLSRYMDSDTLSLPPSYG